MRVDFLFVLEQLDTIARMTITYTNRIYFFTSGSSTAVANSLDAIEPHAASID
jgi:hypothetical protein